LHLATLNCTNFVANPLPKIGQAMKRNLNDRILRGLKPTKPGTHVDVWDAGFPGFGVRVSDTGRRTFVLTARYPGSKNPTRRALGVYDKMSLTDAREKAREWLKLIARGIDPETAEEAARQAALRKQENTFGVVAEEFFKRHLCKTRQARRAEVDIRREFISRWAVRPITEITRRDVLAVIDACVDRGNPYQAHNLLGYARRIFNWAIARGTYGLESSPCDRMRPKEIIGAKKARTRVLNDDELRALWRASEGLGYPYGPLFQMLALTGQRKSEVAEGRWSEFNLTKKLWEIPAARMKADAGHVVPLSDDVLTILASLPRFTKGDYLFSASYGVRPVVGGFDKAKKELDARMRGDLPQLPPFVIHDIRRTMRTGLSTLPVPDLIRELVIAHARPGLHRVYDLHAYEDEKRHALDLWAKRLRDIVTPPPANVVQFETARA
jgi:integrase